MRNAIDKNTMLPKSNSLLNMSESREIGLCSLSRAGFEFFWKDL